MTATTLRHAAARLEALTVEHRVRSLVETTHALYGPPKTGAETFICFTGRALRFGALVPGGREYLV